MKKQMMDFVKSLGGEACYSGEWPAKLYVEHRWKGKEWLIDQLIKRFTRHTQIKFE
jgi:hypothetical protein